MAGVLQKPDALSLAGNLKPFVLSSSAKIVFNLLMGDGDDEEILFINNYEPGPDNLVRIDLRKEIEALLAFHLDTSQDSYAQTGIAKNFKAVIDGQAYIFRVVGGGVADLADTSANWLSQHFLTWQPRHKRVTYYSPEWLSFYATEARTMKLKATYADGTTKRLSLITAKAGEAYTQNLQYAYVAGLLNNTYPVYYEVWTENDNGARSEIQFYLYEEAKSSDEQWFLFTNSLGGIDTVRAYGVNKLAAEHTHSLDEWEEGLEEYNVETERLYVKNTGHLDDYERHWLLDFFPAKRKYIYESGALRRIVVTESEAAYTSSDLPSSYTFTYRRAEKAALLNLVKNTAELPDSITIPDQTSPNFIIPPRLAELPRVSLGEGVLLPAINPSSGVPTVTSFGQIHSAIYDSIVGYLSDELAKIWMGGSGGGTAGLDIIKSTDTTTPTDSNVFSALRTMREIKNSTAAADNRYLRKDISDTAHGSVSFDQAIFASGYKPGENETGWLIEQAGDAAFGDVFSRGMLTVVNDALIGGNLHSRDFWSGWEDGKGWQVSKAGVAELQEASIRHNVIIGNRGGSPRFVSGFPNGIGWDLSPYRRTNAADAAETKWRLEIDDINVRGQLRAYEFVVSQLRGENDNVIFAGMMRVLKADQANEIIYLDTERGVLYNPFRRGDVLMVQRYGGTPTAESQYNVIKQYELRVREAHVGNLTDGEDRVDWIEVEKLVGNWSDVTARDVLTRVDSVVDSTRKGIVKVATVDEIGAPYIDVVYGMKTNPAASTKVRIGNLSGVRTPHNHDLTGVWGLYAEGAVLENSTYYMQNGQTVEQNFTVLNGKLDSEISAIKADMSVEQGNVLKNSSFGSNTHYWDSADEVYFMLTSDGYIRTDECYYTEKQRVADMVSDNGRYVLRLRNSSVTQCNAEMRLGGIDFKGNEETAEDGTKTTVYPQFSFALFCRPLTDGTLKVGFMGKDLYTEEQLTASNTYKQISKYAEWDGTGDFVISYTGEILIYGVSLRNDKLADAKIYLEGRITQTAEALTIDYKKLIKDGDDALKTEYTTKIEQTAESITASLHKAIYTNDAMTTTRWDAAIQATATQLTSKYDAILYQTDSYGNPTNKLRYDSLISQNAEAISLRVKSEDYTGNTIISKINLTDVTATIKAERINLKGKVTLSMFNEDDKSKLALKTDLSGFAAKSDLPNLDAYMKKETYIEGAYIKTGLINTDELYATHLRAAYGTVGGFSISSASLSGKNLTGQTLMQLDPSGGIYFKSADDKRYAGYGIQGISAVTGLNALTALWQKSTTESKQTGLFVRCDSAEETQNLLLTYSSGASYRYCSIGFRHYKGDAAWFRRLCMRVNWMPIKNLVENTNGVAPTGHPVYWDEKSGLIYVA